MCRCPKVVLKKVKIRVFESEMEGKKRERKIIFCSKPEIINKMINPIMVQTSWQTQTFNVTVKHKSKCLSGVFLALWSKHGDSCCNYDFLWSVCLISLSPLTFNGSAVTSAERKRRVEVKDGVMNVLSCRSCHHVWPVRADTRDNGTRSRFSRLLTRIKTVTQLGLSPDFLTEK